MVFSPLGGEGGHYHYGKVKHGPIRTRAGLRGAVDHMIRHGLTLLALLTVAVPANAQNEPFRIVNGARVPANGLYLMRSGQEAWGRNLLREPLAPGAALSMRPPEGAGCRFDIRLTFQDGQDAIRRGADVCEDRVVVVAEGADTTSPAAPPLPQVGGGDRMLPSIGGRD